MTRTAPGFSLIEMAIVLTILGALLSGLLVALGQSTENSRRIEARNELRDFSEALYGFAQYYRYMLKQVAEKTNVTLVRQGEIS